MVHQGIVHQLKATIALLDSRWCLQSAKACYSSIILMCASSLSTRQHTLVQMSWTFGINTAQGDCTVSPWCAHDVASRRVQWRWEGCLNIGCLFQSLLLEYLPRPPMFKGRCCQLWWILITTVHFWEGWGSDCPFMELLIIINETVNQVVTSKHIHLCRPLRLQQAHDRVEAEVWYLVTWSSCWTADSGAFSQASPMYTFAAKFMVTIEQLA